MKNIVRLKKILLIVTFVLLAVYIAKRLVEIISVSSLDNQAVCVPIIMYHHVKNTNLGKNTICPSEFESDLKYLKENEFNTITMTQLIEYVYEDKVLPSNPVILSFDDGHLDTYLNVFPLLKKYEMKIVLSIVGKSVDDFTRIKDTNIEYSVITWDQVKEMEASGFVEIQNHTYDLHKARSTRYGCGQMKNESLSHYEKIIYEDVNVCHEKLNEVIHTVPNTFTYPFGKYNDNTESILKKLGYKATLTCKYGVNLIETDPDCLYELKRICRSHNEGIEKLIKEGMLTLKLSSK